MSTWYILDDDNKPVPVGPMQAAVWLETNGRRVTVTNLPDDVTVSTVFLGIDHSYGDGPPVLWETMIFGGEFDQETMRYTSHEDALEGHKKMVRKALEFKI